jgi:hypothetical protein
MVSMIFILHYYNLKVKKLIICLAFFYCNEIIAQKEGSYKSLQWCKRRWHLNLTAYRIANTPYRKDSVSYFTFINKKTYWLPATFLDSLLKLKHHKYAFGNGVEKLIKRFEEQNVLR